MPLFLGFYYCFFLQVRVTISGSDMSTIGIERAGDGEEACWLEGVVHVVCWFMLVCLLF